MQASPFAGAGLGPFEDAVPYPAGPLDAFRQGSGSGRDARCAGRVPKRCRLPAALRRHPAAPLAFRRRSTSRALCLCCLVPTH